MDIDHVGALPSPDAAAPGWDLTIDAILFADGELVGPDTLHLRETIIARKTAATKVTAALRAAQANRANLSVVFAELMSVPSEFLTSPPSAERLMELNEVRRVARDLQCYENDPQRFEWRLGIDAPQSASCFLVLPWSSAFALK